MTGQYRKDVTRNKDVEVGNHVTYDQRGQLASLLGGQRMSNHEQVSVAEVERVQGRVGRTALARLQWAVKFAQTDLDSLTSGDWQNVRCELLAFSAVFIPYRAARSRPTQEGLRRLGTGRARGSLGLPTLEETRKTRDEFRGILEPFMAHGVTTVGPLTATYRLVRHDRVTREGGTETLREILFPVPFQELVHQRKVSLFPFARDRNFFPLPLGLGVLLHLLAAHGELLETCPECRSWFVANRTNQAYCVTRCLSRKTTRASREKARKRARPRRARQGGARSV